MPQSCLDFTGEVEVLGIGLQRELLVPVLHRKVFWQVCTISFTQLYPIVFGCVHAAVLWGEVQTHCGHPIQLNPQLLKVP